MSKTTVKNPEQALNSLMGLCARGEKSSGDALRLMAQWGVDEAKRREVLDLLVQNKFIDDRRYAASYVRDKSRLSRWGVYKIKNGLQLKGIDQGIIDESLQTLDKVECKGQLDVIIEKKMHSSTESNTHKLKGKLVRYALGMGYEYESVISAVEKILKDE